MKGIVRKEGKTLFIDFTIKKRQGGTMYYYHKTGGTIEVTKEDYSLVKPGMIADFKYNTDHTKAKIVKTIELVTEKSEILGCGRCEINTIKYPTRMIPCPRGGCEAETIANITTEKKIIITYL